MTDRGEGWRIVIGMQAPMAELVMYRAMVCSGIKKE